MTVQHRTRLAFGGDRRRRAGRESGGPGTRPALHAMALNLVDRIAVKHPTIVAHPPARGASMLPGGFTDRISFLLTRDSARTTVAVRPVKDGPGMD